MGIQHIYIIKLAYLLGFTNMGGKKKRIILIKSESKKVSSLRIFNHYLPHPLPILSNQMLGMRY